MKSKYKRMIRGIKKKERNFSDRKNNRKWFLYILQCHNGAFYTGITNDLQRRIQMHRDGKASRYTRTRRPVKLLYSEICRSRIEALVREYKVKALPKIKKQELIVRKQERS